jgi:hypothetical protein
MPGSAVRGHAGFSRVHNPPVNRQNLTDNWNIQKLNPQAKRDTIRIKQFNTELTHHFPFNSFDYHVLISEMMFKTSHGYMDRYSQPTETAT